MSSQMYTDLIVDKLIGASTEGSESTIFNFPFVGTLSGGSVVVDALSDPIPLSEFRLLVDDRKETKPQYQNGDRLFIVPANDGNQLVIIGRLI